MAHKKKGKKLTGAEKEAFKARMAAGRKKAARKGGAKKGRKKGKRRGTAATTATETTKRTTKRKTKRGGAKRSTVKRGKGRPNYAKRNVSSRVKNLEVKVAGHSKRLDHHDSLFNQISSRVRIAAGLKPLKGGVANKKAAEAFPASAFGKLG